jgi:hypothetical protein
MAKPPQIGKLDDVVIYRSAAFNHRGREMGRPSAHERHAMDVGSDGVKNQWGRSGSLGRCAFRLMEERPVAFEKHRISSLKSSEKDMSKSFYFDRGFDN